MLAKVTSLQILLILILHKDYEGFPLITPKVVINLTDDEFDLLGIAKNERCRDYITASEFPEKSLVMKRLRSLQASRKGKMKKPSLVNNRKVKDTRRICLGWKHFENGHYKMVTLNKGVGIIHHDFSKTCTMDEMIAICNNHYFPNGINTQKGIQIKHVEYYLANFTGTPIKMKLKSGNPFNLGDFLDEINSCPVRLYLHTRIKVK